jgi:cell wall-active antibiotic response 4TMS protein YvqF
VTAMDDIDLDRGNERVIRPGSIAGGLIVLTLGVAMLLDRSGAADIRTGHLIAPLVLIAIGAMIAFDRATIVCGRRDPVTRRPKRRGDSLSGLWLIGIGAWMMVSELHLFGLTYGTSWPLVVVLGGVMMVVRGALEPPVARDTHE